MPTTIFHITHRNNLPGILARGGIYCDRDCQENNLTAVRIGYSDIKQRRFYRTVHVRGQAEGVVADYVPFYFGPRSPMLFTISNGNVEGYPEGQGPVAHLVVSADAIAGADLPFVYSDRNAALAYAQFHDVLDDLGEHVDLALMEARYWHNTPQQPDRMERRMAEFLVRDFLPWEYVEAIGVMSQAEAKLVNEMLEVHQGHRPAVAVRREWYY